jgi:hypothetical protein
MHGGSSVMKRRSLFLRAAMLLAMLSVPACGGDGDYQDSLTFGTGVTGTGFTLAGEATSFSLQALKGNPIWFRLESAADINSRFVRLYFNDVTNKDYTAVQKYGHITLSNFPVTTVGSFSVKAYYVETVIDIGQETLIATNTLSVTP